MREFINTMQFIKISNEEENFVHLGNFFTRKFLSYSSLIYRKRSTKKELDREES